jgi:hypothetical protein
MKKARNMKENRWLEIVEGLEQEMRSLGLSRIKADDIRRRAAEAI